MLTEVSWALPRAVREAGIPPAVRARFLAESPGRDRSREILYILHNVLCLQNHMKTATMRIRWSVRTAIDQPEVHS